MNGLSKSVFCVLREDLMAKRSKIAQAAFDIAAPEAEKLGLELVDAEYKKEGQSTFLRLFIDKKGGLDIDDCEKFSRIIDPILDEKVHHDADYFEVSSPGLTRPLTEKADFVRYSDEKIDNILKSQLSEQTFRENADVVIDNSGALENACAQVDHALGTYGIRKK